MMNYRKKHNMFLYYVFFYIYIDSNNIKYIYR